jgi:integrase
MAFFEQRKNGWRAQVRRKGMPSISRTFDLKTDAEAWAREVERAAQRGDIAALEQQAQRTTLAEVLDRYEADRLPHLRGQAGAASRLRRIREQFGGHFLANVRGVDIAAWRDAMLASGLAAGTALRHLGVLSALFSFAEKDLGIPLPAGNPCRSVRKPASGKGRDRRLRPGEYEALQADRPDLLAFVILAVETSMRRSEICGLQWERVSLTRHTASLPDTKNGESRTVALSSVAVAALQSLPRRIDGRMFGWVHADGFSLAFRRHRIAARKAHVLARLREALAADELPADALESEIRALVYKHRQPSPRTAALFEQIDASDPFLKNLRFHDLRHEAASRLFEKGLGIMEVASMTGHKSLSMLKRYTHIEAEKLAKKLG